MWRGCGFHRGCSRHHDRDNGHHHHDSRVLVRPYHHDVGGADDHAAWLGGVLGAMMRIYPHAAAAAAHSADCHSGDDAQCPVAHPDPVFRPELANICLKVKVDDFQT